MVEAVVLACLSGLDLALVFGYRLGLFGVSPTLLFVLSLAVLGWLIARLSEVAVGALEKFSKAAGAPPYLTGVLSSLASSLPEIALTLIAVMSGDPEVVEVAVLTVMMSVGAATVIVSATAAVASIKSGRGVVEVPKEAMSDELNAIAFTLTAYLALSLVSMARLFSGHSNQLPRTVGLILLLAYFSYILTLVSRAGGRRRGTGGAARHLLVGLAAMVPIFISAEVLVYLVEELTTAGGLDAVHAAAALALVGTVPENGVAIVSAAKGDVEIGLGNAMSGVTILALLAVGIVASVRPIPLDDYVVAQMGVTTASALILKFSVRDDGKVDLGEAILMVALQALAFDLLLT